MYNVNVMVGKKFPSLLLSTRECFQRTAVPLSGIKYLRPSLVIQNDNTYSMKCSSTMSNKCSCPARYVPHHHSRSAVRFANISASARVPFSTSSDQPQVKKKLMGFKTVSEIIHLFETSRKSFDATGSVTALHTIAVVVWKDAVQRTELQRHRGGSQQGHSVFRDLLNHIADNIGNLDKKHKDDIVWSLKKIQETNHRLYQLADK